MGTLFFQSCGLGVGVLRGFGFRAYRISQRGGAYCTPQQSFKSTSPSTDIVDCFDAGTSGKPSTDRIFKSLRSGSLKPPLEVKLLGAQAKKICVHGQDFPGSWAVGGSQAELSQKPCR